MPFPFSTTGSMASWKSGSSSKRTNSKEDSVRSSSASNHFKKRASTTVISSIGSGMNVEIDQDTGVVGQHEKISHLESIALLFVEQAQQTNLVQDRKYHLKTYEQCFVGSDAVTLLVKVLETKGYTRVTRQQAVQLGRDICQEFGLFRHVVDDHDFEDDKLFYKFQNNLPSTVTQAIDQAGNNMWDLMDFIESKLDIQDRVYHFRTYPQCFVGQECVDLILGLHLAIDRQDAVQLMLDINRSCGMCEHVTRDHEFEDKYYFYRLIPSKERLINPLNERQTFGALLDAMDLDNASVLSSLSELSASTNATSTVGQATSQELWDDSEQSRLLDKDGSPQQQHQLATSVDNDANGGRVISAFHRRASSMDSNSSHSSSSTISSHHSGSLQDHSNASSATSTVNLLPPNVTLQDIATALERDLIIKDHRYHFRVYKNCFVARDAVTYLVDAKLASSRSRAELIGRQLQKQLNLFHHVTRDHQFRDKYYFFRFTPLDQRTQPSPTPPKVVHKPSSSRRQRAKQKLKQAAMLSPSPEDGQEQLPPPPIPQKRRLGSRLTSLQTIMSDIAESQTSLEDIAMVVERGLKTKDRVYYMTNYKHTFTGQDLIKYLVAKGFAETRQDAVLLGRLLATELHLFQHIRIAEKELFDCPITLYQFVPVEDRKAQLEVKREITMERLRSQSIVANKDDTVTMLANLPDESTGTFTTVGDKALMNTASILRQGVKIKNNRYHGKIYPSTFIGSQAVDFMVNSSIAKTRKEAVQIGRRIMHELQQFDHVTREHDFADDYKFYRYEEHRDSAHQGLHQSSLSSMVQSVLENSLTGLSAAKSTLHRGLSNDSKHSTFTPIQSAADMSIDFIPLEKIAHDLYRNLLRQDRRYRFTTYKDVFIGSDAVDFLVARTPWASSREEAVLLGQTLMRELDLFQHVTKAHNFQDAELFYKFTDEDEEALSKRLEELLEESQLPFSDKPGAISAVKLAEVAKAMEEGLTPSDNSYRMRVYRDTLVGTEIISFLVDNKLAETRGEAVQLGRMVAKHFHLFEHVTVDHLLKDSVLFYQFVPRQQRRGQWFMHTYGNKLKHLHRKATNAPKRLSVKQYWDAIVDALKKEDFELMLMKVEDASIKQFLVESDDPEWSQRVVTFELRVSKRDAELGRLSFASGMSSSIVTTRMAEDAFQRLKCWSSTFIRLDPRQQIHRFYNEVAQTGATPIHDGKSGSVVRAITIDALRPLFRFLPINLAQVFSVWRPTSYDAIRKMMMGEAVGKGLDIKGKSAKRGKLSGFVPFLQINDNKHKSKVRRLSPNQMVRVFYKSECRRARDAACVELEKVLEEMIETVGKAKKVLASDNLSSDIYENALMCMLLEVENPSITPINDYAPQCYGIEIPERLFWEAYFVRQDCTRKEGSMYDTGRPSQPAFQDMNFSALRAEPHDGAPKAVVYQYAERDDPMNPFELLMAYEEKGRVLPVVSDFDCFLVGTRRVQYNLSMPPEQLEVLHWCVKQIEAIVEKLLLEKEAKVNYSKNRSPKSASTSSRKSMLKSKKHQLHSSGNKSWSYLWLQVLKDSSFHPKIPQFGFGDPVSYSIVENAVERLHMNGAVRHGAECFNYYFPQDLDDEFLVVSEQIGDGNVPWKYVDVEELQDILASKIDEGFCFPLNPKWILYDPGWMTLYQKLLDSQHKHVQDAMNIWYPPDSGLREDFDRIYGLQRKLKRLDRELGINSDEVNPHGGALSRSTQQEMMYFT